MQTMVNKIIRPLVAIALIVAILSFTVLTFYALFPVKYENLISSYSEEYDVDKSLILALMKAESNFDEKALSDAGAKGLMQLTDETFLFCAEQLGLSEKDMYDTEANLRAGIWYLSFLLDKYDNNTENAVAAYNAGFSNVDKWLSSPKHSKDGKNLDSIPFGETQRHVDKIIKYREIYTVLY